VADLLEPSGSVATSETWKGPKEEPFPNGIWMNKYHLDKLLVQINGESPNCFLFHFKKVHSSIRIGSRSEIHTKTAEKPVILGLEDP